MVRTSVVGLLAAILCLAAPDSKPGIRKLQSEALIDAARACPPEFASDALIRIATARVHDRKRKKELIEEAFRLATGAQNPYPLRAHAGSLVDTRSGYLSRAFEAQLDALSLECRAVAAMLPLDKQKARELFAEIPPLTLRRLDCEEPLYPDVSVFYTTLSDVAGQSFTPQEIARNEQANFVAGYARSLTSPVQTGPMARAITTIAMSRANKEELAGAFSTTLGEIRGDDRTFSSALYETLHSAGDLAAHCKQMGIPNVVLLQTVREYLLRHLNSRRCADALQTEKRARPIDHFNHVLRAAVFPLNVEIPPIMDSESAPAELAGSIKVHEYWQTPQAKKLLDKFSRLRMTVPALSSPQEKKAEWMTGYDNFLNDLADWKEESEDSVADYFHQKCVLLTGLLDLAPSGIVRAKILRSYLGFLGQHYFQNQSRIEWFQHVKDLLGQSATPQTLDQFRGSPNPVIGLYADLVPLH